MDVQTVAIAQQAKVMRDSYEAERALNLDFEGVLSNGVDIPFGPPTSPQQVVTIPGCGIKIWNHGPHKIRVVGFEFTSPCGPGSTNPMQLAIGSEESGDLNITRWLFGLVAHSEFHPDVAELKKLHSRYFEAKLHCVGVGGRKEVPIAFQATWVEDQSGKRIHLAIVPVPQPQSRAATN